MQREQIQEFTRRITQSNRTGLTIVTYDIFFVYLADAVTALNDKSWDMYKQSIRQAQRSLNELINTLNFSYKLSAELYRTYVYCRELLSVAMYKRSEVELQECEELMKMLYESFVKVAETDDSASLMKNTEQVYAGYTYGRKDVNEGNPNAISNRGFFA